MSGSGSEGSEATRIDVGGFRVGEGEPASLAKRATRVDPVYGSKADYAEILAEHVAAPSTPREHLFRSTRYALLIVLQGMDTAGKNGAIAHVMSGVNPQGCKVVAFKQATPAEAGHDFLWREVRDAPPPIAIDANGNSASSQRRGMPAWSDRRGGR